MKQLEALEKAIEQEKVAVMKEEKKNKQTIQEKSVQKTKKK